MIALRLRSRPWVFCNFQLDRWEVSRLPTGMTPAAVQGYVSQSHVSNERRVLSINLNAHISRRRPRVRAYFPNIRAHTSPTLNEADLMMLCLGERRLHAQLALPRSGARRAVGEQASRRPDDVRIEQRRSACARTPNIGCKRHFLRSQARGLCGYMAVQLDTVGEYVGRARNYRSRTMHAAVGPEAADIDMTARCRPSPKYTG